VTEKEIGEVEIIDITGAFVKLSDFLRIKSQLEEAVEVIKYSRMYNTNDPVERFLERWYK
jgi:hypothetical protein